MAAVLDAERNDPLERGLAMRPPSPSRSPWIVSPRLVPRPRLRLICAPYAGGGAAVYRGWADKLPSSIEVSALQLPGREQRYREPLLTDMPTIVAEAAKAVEPLFADAPVVLFGHSMGAIIVYEMARILLARSGLRPLALVVSGRIAPHRRPSRTPAYDLPDPAFIDHLRKLNGTPAAILENEELLQIVLPIVRADFRAIETYRPFPGPMLDCPILALGGDSDPEVGEQALMDWQTVTSGRFDSHIFSGDHFFLASHEGAVLRQILRSIGDWSPIALAAS